jgi:RHS repeat-associated protein
MQIAYTTDGLLTSLTNPRGHVSQYGFDTLGRLTSATDPTNATKTLARVGTHQDYTVTLTSPLGRTSTYRVEHLGTGDIRQTLTSAAGGQAQTVRRKDGTKSTILPDGTTINLALGPDPRWKMHAPVAKSITVRTPGGLVNTRTGQRTTTLTDPTDLLSLRTLTETVTVNGRVFTRSYDATTRTVTHTTPTSRQVTLVIDSRARPVQHQLSGLSPRSYAYDERGRPSTITWGTGPDSRLIGFAYGSNGFLASIMDPLSRTIAFTSDANGQVTQQTLPDEGIIGYGYDNTPNLTAVAPPGQPNHTFSYTARNEVSTYTPPPVGVENGQIGFTYDPDGRPTRVDRPDGQPLSLQYDSAGRLSQLDLSASQRNYGYNAAGVLTSVSTSQAVGLDYAYDGRLLTSTTWTGAVAGSAGRTYDNNLRITSLSVNGSNPIAIQRNADGLPIQVGALALTRSAQSGLVTATALGSSSDATSYDGFGAPATYTASHNGAAVYAATYTRDALGRITSKTETIGGATRVADYAYDAAGRLSEVREDATLVANFGYDANGNRLSFTGPGGTINASYDAQDRLIQYGSTSYAYTPTGELASKTTGGQITSYRYDALGNLIGVTMPDGTEIDYLLDGQNRRVGKQVNGALVQGFLYLDGIRPTAELDGTGAVVSRFVYAGRSHVPAYLITGAATYRIITDQVGSPRLVIDAASGAVAQELDHDVFGNVVLDTNPGFQPFGFAGGLYDRQTGLVHFGAREYDPETGRWTSKDPIGFGGGDPNLYGYVFGDPVNGIDPLGLFCDGGFTCGMLRDEREMLEGRMSSDEYRERQVARGFGGIIGVGAVATVLGVGALVEGVESLGLWLASRAATCPAAGAGGTVATGAGGTAAGGTAATTAAGAIADTLPGATALYAGLTPGQLGWIQRMADTLGLAQQRMAAFAAGDQAAIDRIASTWDGLFKYAKYIGQ